MTVYREDDERIDALPDEFSSSNTLYRQNDPGRFNAVGQSWDELAEAEQHYQARKMELYAASIRARRAMPSYSQG